MNRIMSEGVCSQFLPHAWKADVCANCLKPRLKHVDNADVCVTPQSPQSTSCPSMLSKHVNTQLSDSAQVSHKSSPAKVKPVVLTKPEKPKKPCLVGDHASVKTDVKQCEEFISAEHPTPSKMKNAVANNSSHLQFTEAEKICDVDAPEVIRTMEMHIEDENDVHLNDKTFHHYEVYDVTARGLSETQLELGVDDESASKDKIIDQSLESERRKFKTLPVAAMRVVEVAEQHVAMPYNVVDVTVQRPRASNITQLSSDITSVGSNSTNAPTNTWPNKPQPAKRQMVPKSPPKPRERVTKPKEQTSSSSDIEVSSRQEPDGSDELPADASKIVQSDLVSERYAHRIYEDIEDFETDQFSSKTTAHSFVNKSPAFEAKLAALSSLDFGKTAKQVTIETPTVNPPVESTPVKTDIASSVQDTVVVPASKPEKTRKSGGKTFFQKFLKFGSKDTSEAARSSALSGSDEASLKAAQCPDIPLPGNTNVSDDGKSPPDAVPSQAAPLNEKQVMMMNLKDCLAKRQTSISSDSSEVPPVHSRTRSFDPTPSRSSVQSVSSLQQAHGNNVEKSDKHTVVLPETSPPVVSKSSSPSIHDQPTSTNISFPPPQHAYKELSETDKSFRSVDKTSNEMQRLEVKDLTVVTEDIGNVDSSVSICSSDAVSPTPSDLSLEGGDHHSLKRKSRTDRQGNSRIYLLVFYYVTSSLL